MRGRLAPRCIPFPSPATFRPALRSSSLLFAIFGTAGALGLGTPWLSGGSSVRPPETSSAPAAIAIPGVHEVALPPAAAIPAAPEAPSVRPVAAVTATAALAWRTPATLPAEAGRQPVPTS